MVPSRFSLSSHEPPASTRGRDTRLEVVQLLLQQEAADGGREVPDIHDTRKQACPGFGCPGVVRGDNMLLAGESRRASLLRRERCILKRGFLRRVLPFFRPLPRSIPPPPYGIEGTRASLLTAWTRTVGGATRASLDPQLAERAIAGQVCIHGTNRPAGATPTW